MRVGVESAHSFGDILFNVPLIKAIGESYNSKPWVAVRPPFKDALNNVPWISGTIDISNMGDGDKALRAVGCQETIQITQNVKFFEFKQANPNHSLIDTPTETGHQLGLVFDPKPIFLPTSNEITQTECLASDRPTIAIEAFFKSGQSWANNTAIDSIINKYRNTHRVLWLSHTPPPAGVTSLSHLTRRETIMCLRFADILFSVGSGFFCASLALNPEWQPRNIVCLWIDELYRYEQRLLELQWHKSITWIHNQQDLQRWLTTA